MTEPYAIHWFRRDLRIAGNPALQLAWKEHPGRVLGIFCFDRTFLSRADFSRVRFQFFLQTLWELRAEMAAMGGELLFLDMPPQDAFAKLLESLRAKPDLVTWNRDYEPFARERDARMLDFLNGKGLRTLTERDHVLIEPHEVYKGDDPQDGYQVFTPFSRRWLQIFATGAVRSRVEVQKNGIAYLDTVNAGNAKPIFELRWKDVLPASWIFSDLLETYKNENAKHVSFALPKAGCLAGLGALREFKKRLEFYSDQRDLPALAGTSRLSVYFKNGSLTVGQAIAELGLGTYEKTDKSGNAKFLSELIWREFYYSILTRFPDVEHDAFQKRFRSLRWQNREDWFEAWKAGNTGFPIVDAGMRELNTTGWMHNRVRMIVASFLTKDLLIDWRWGERYFMERLLDGDLAPNNGGWQWAASTGCDPQPYFRIFNPELQSRKFDPEGNYIRRFIPELKRLDGKTIHAPPAQLRGDYPRPIVEHRVQRELALKFYSSAI